MFDPDARPIHKGKLGKPNEFGYVLQICEVTQNTRRGARGFILPASTRRGNPPESKLLPDTTAELERLGLRPREVALDGGFEQGPSAEALQRIESDRVFIAGRQQPGSRRPQRRLGATVREPRAGSVSSYVLRRSRPKGQAEVHAWSAWAILAYNLDTLAIRAS